MKDNKIESDLLRKYWDSINPIYYSFKDWLIKNQSEIESNNLYYFLIQEWESVYKSFVLEPMRSKFLNLFTQAQTIDFKPKNPTKDKIKECSIMYNIYEGLYIEIEPNHYYYDYEYDVKDFLSLRFSMKKTESPNIILCQVFEDIGLELGLGSVVEDIIDLNDSEFYDIQLKLLRSFLSECWNEAKNLTKSNVKGILLHSNVIDTDYDLDENKELDD